MRVAPAINSTDVQLLLRDRYETTYGIYNHDVPANDRQLALVGMHLKEDTYRHSLLHERIRMFGVNEVHKHYGLNLKEFLELPTDVCSLILEECAKLRGQSNKQTDDIVSRLEKEMGKG
jgi:hypothetical protein